MSSAGRRSVRRCEKALLMQRVSFIAFIINASDGCREEKRDNVKSPEVIDKIEKSLPEKLRHCRYCGGQAREYVNGGRSFKGDEGFVGTVKCTDCGTSVTAFGRDVREALVMAKWYWCRGIYEG